MKRPSVNLSFRPAIPISPPHPVTLLLAAPFNNSSASASDPNKTINFATKGNEIVRRTSTESLISRRDFIHRSTVPAIRSTTPPSIYAVPPTRTAPPTVPQPSPAAPQRRRRDRLMHSKTPGFEQLLR
ncbi:hypothetical protein GWI33_005856 [Rhynchophorus ferrugineus]|uniref:Uncharacterized protein n=1 Tax=Rhynchophorus ferrugineus TaxID=354439 RepID=A0A834IJD7_RHYFE|nr:hypothetical protein GWI33_005856 [Rhynchophorus ferrugineus]